MFHELSAGRTRLERVTEVLRLTDHVPVLELHDAHDIKRLPVIGEDEFADPEIAATEHASHGEAFRVRLGGARRLNVGSTTDALARLRIIENCVGSIDLVLRRVI